MSCWARTLKAVLGFCVVGGYMMLWVWLHEGLLRGNGNAGQMLVNSSSEAQVRVNDLIRDAWLALGSRQHPEDLESAAILGAKTFREARGERRGQRTKPLLCATFTTSRKEALELVLDNMKQMRGHCEWAVLFYDLGEDHSSVRLMEHSAAELGVTVVKAGVVPSRQSIIEAYGVDLSVRASKFTSFIKLAPPLRKAILDDDNFYEIGNKGKAQSRVAFNSSFLHRSVAYNSMVYPKALQFLGLLDLLPNYERVWLLDADISLRGFRPDRFLLVVDCAFEEPPLVTQPLIAERTQSYKFLNADSWKQQLEQDAGTTSAATASEPRVLATASAFVEIQAPLLDAAFFEWFLRFLVVPMAVPSHILGADWGFDALFCRAAQVFSTHSTFPTSLVGPQASGEPCMVVVAGTPVHHIDRRDLDHNLGRDVKKALNKALMRIIQASFPTLYKNGHDKDANMLLPAHSGKYRRTTRFLSRDPKCTHRRPKLRAVG